MSINYDTLSAQKAQLKLCDKTVSAELSNDYTLPDYQPEIRRVLRVSATVLPTSKYVGTSRCELSGAVDYKLLYVGSDGRLYTAPLASEYSVSVPLELGEGIELSEEIALLCDAYAEGVSARVSAPRRLSVKSRVCVRVRGYGSAVLEEQVTGECDEKSVQRLIASSRSEHIRTGVGESRELTAEIDMPSESTRVVDASAELYIAEARASDSFVDCEGEVRLTLLLCDDEGDGEIKTVVHKLPFEESVELEESVGECGCTARGYVSDLKVSADEGSILCVMSVFTEVAAHAESETVYTKDLYSTEKKSECAYKSFKVPTQLCSVSSNFSQNEKIELTERDSALGAVVVCSFCECSASGCVYDNGKYTMSGNSKYSVVIRKDEEYSTYERDIPFRYEFSGEGPAQSYFASVSPISCDVRIDGNVMSVASELSVIAQMSGEREISYVSDVRYLEGGISVCGDMIVSYPDNEDTLWSVSKRYSCPLIKLEGICEPEAKLDGVDYIIVNF